MAFNTSLLIGHSLGGAAVLAVAKDIPEVRAVATIGAPADAAHVLKNFGTSLKEIQESGEAEVDLAGRRFLVKQQFIEDARAQRISEAVAALKKPLLILHSPLDQTVGIENATNIFVAAKHPKALSHWTGLTIFSPSPKTRSSRRGSFQDG